MASDQPKKGKQRRVFSNDKDWFEKRVAQAVAEGWIVKEKTKDDRGFYSAILICQG